ncbi:MAG TPA: M56 family metallopeptidase [Vicinamibacterales bacterium]|nr:M56 family metallopeptidase [Vicinamibacterales bacterium]
MSRTVADTALLLSQSPELSLVAKATLILLVGLAAIQFARHARASVRHLVMVACFAALIALPVLMAAAPSMTIEVPVAASAPAASRQRGIDRSEGLSPPDSKQGSGSQRGAVERAVPLRLAPLTLVRLAWVIGAVVFLVPVAAVLWRLSVIRRTGLPIAWHREVLTRLVREQGVRRPVEVLEHEAVPGPMTFGVARPVIILPPDAREWDEPELRRALVHELEHIQRGDWVMQIGARIIAACYWFHPLVWTAWRRLGLEAERSCDDAVVMGEERTDYAEQLVTLAQRMSATPVQPLLGMANRSDLSTRVTAVLDDRLRRGRAGLPLAVGTLVAAALVVVAVAPVRAVAKAPLPEANAEAEQRRFPAPGERRTRALDRELYEAATAGDFAGVRELVEAGANANAAIDGDGSPLIGAARSGRLQIAQYLLDQGADPNLTVPGDGSALIMAAKFGRLDQVALLIDRGADVNLAVEGDENPLMNAAEQGHLEIVKFLVDQGADIHARIQTRSYINRQEVDEWRTALSQAQKNRRADVVQFLQSVGARE